MSSKTDGILCISFFMKVIHPLFWFDYHQCPQVLFKNQYEYWIFQREMMYQMANDIYSEFFIGIGEDQNEISFAKSKLLN